MTPGDDLLRLYVAGALEPADAARVEAWIAADARVAERVQAIADEPLDLPPRSPWRLPPPGLGLALSAGQPAHLGPRRVRVGDVIELELPDSQQPGDTLLVLLRRQGSDWQVLAPDTQQQCRTLASLPVGSDGRRRLGVVVPPPAGTWRLALVLAPADLDLDWTRPPRLRWQGLLDQVRRRTAPAGTVELVVDER